jgi:phage protein D
MRDPQMQDRLHNSFKVSYPDFPSLSGTVRSIVINQEMGKHDIAEILYPLFDTAYFEVLKTGVPVEITWKNDKVSGKFLGYTVDVSHTVAQQFDRSVKIMCIGSSYPLKERASKIWVNKTASEIATEIAKKFKLKPVVTSSSIRFTQQSLSGHSYWEKLNELAKRIGYGVQVIGAELHFHPIDKMIDQFMTTIPMMSFKDPLEHPASKMVGPTLEYFEPKVGDYLESNEYTRTTPTVSGVDPISGKSYSSKSSSNKVGKNLRKITKDPLFSSIETSVVVASNAMAKSLSEARAQMGRLGISADGVGQGDPRISPWRTVEVSGTGMSSDGFWIVKSARHVVQGDGRYEVEFTCLSDGVGLNKPSAFRPSSAGPVPFRNTNNEMATNPKGKPTSTKLSAAASMVKQTNAGYLVTPRRWSGK